jgi:hypothetical protein
MLTEYDAEVAIQESGALLKPRVAKINTILNVQRNPARHNAKGIQNLPEPGITA